MYLPLKAEKSVSFWLAKLKTPSYP